MTYEKNERVGKDIRAWRLELIKQRHREVILAQRDDPLSDEIISDDMPELDGPGELDALGLDPEYELDI